MTPAAFGLSYRDVSFPAREDGVVLRGWVIPGVLPAGQLTTDRTIILVHPHLGNRAEPDVGILDISAALARNGFAVLAYDSRGSGDSPPVPFSAGLFEQRDVLGAVDFLRGGSLPYPALGRPRAIGAIGISGGDAGLLFAAAREPAIQAVVSDDGFADVLPIIERDVRATNNLLSPFLPGALLAARLIYGIDFTRARPVDVVAQIAPRPLFFIHGGADGYIPPNHFYQLIAAARAAPDAHVESWLVPDAHHARDFRAAPAEYTAHVTAFFTQALGSDARHP